jgi:hypothetical protein
VVRGAASHLPLRPRSFAPVPPLQTLLPGAPLVDAAADKEAAPAYYRPDKLVRTGAG